MHEIVKMIFRMVPRQGKQKFVWSLFCLFSLIILTANSFAVINKRPLGAEQAFKVSARINQRNIITTWEIAPGYYLYRERFNFSFKPPIPFEIQYPRGKFKEEPDGKKVEMYSGKTIIPLVIGETSPALLSFSIDYQGCSKQGFCYPPMQKNFMVDFKAGTISYPALKPPPENAPLKDLLKNQQGVKELLEAHQPIYILFLFLGMGILLAFTPCVLPMIPILTGIIVGQKGHVTIRRSFLLSSSYVLGNALTYALAGVLAAAMGNSLQVWLQQSWIIVLTGGLFVLLAFSLFGFYDLRLPKRVHNHLTVLSNRQKGGTYVGVFIMGILSSLIVSPCVTAPLVGVLLYIGQTGNLFFGGAALFMMGLGMGLPLIVIGITAGKWLPKRGSWMEAVKKFFGLIMLGMAVWLLSRVVPKAVTYLAWLTLLLIFAYLIGNYLPLLMKKKRFIHRPLGVLIGLGLGVIILGAIGVENPINWITTDPQLISGTVRPFIVVRNLADLKKQLQAAHEASKPVILDFYADWCESCVAMDRNVFSKTNVQHELASYVLLRADLSANTAMDEALLRQFDVIAPPTILFFDRDGREINSQRIVGEVNANEFLTHINTLGENVALPKQA